MGEEDCIQSAEIVSHSIVVNKNEVLFFSLLRNALWNTTEDFPEKIAPETSGALLRLAEEQTVSGLIIDALIRNDIHMEQQTVFETFCMLEQIKKANREVNRELLLFAELMAAKGLDYVVCKGQTIAALYPDPLLRMPGDIDFLVYDYQAAQRLLQKEWGICLPNCFIEKEVAFRHNSVTYELHTQLITFCWRSHQRYWESMMQRPHQSIVLVDGKEVKTLSPNIYAIYVFAHLFFHFIREGIGLRQMCDWAIILDLYKNEIDQSQLAADLDGLGITRAYRAFGGVLTNYLGLKSFPLAQNEKDLKASEQILKDILRYGNFGKPSRKVQQSGWKFKMETMGRTVRNCCKYFWLAPKEVVMIIPKLITLNVKLLLQIG